MRSSLVSTVIACFLAGCLVEYYEWRTLPRNAAFEVVAIENTTVTGDANGYIARYSCNRNTLGEYSSVQGIKRTSTQVQAAPDARQGIPLDTESQIIAAATGMRVTELTLSPFKIEGTGLTALTIEKRSVVMKFLMALGAISGYNFGRRSTAAKLPACNSDVVLSHLDQKVFWDDVVRQKMKISCHAFFLYADGKAYSLIGELRKPEVRKSSEYQLWLEPQAQLLEHICNVAFDESKMITPQDVHDSTFAARDMAEFLNAYPLVVRAMEPTAKEIRILSATRAINRVYQDSLIPVIRALEVIGLLILCAVGAYIGLFIYRYRRSTTVTNGI